MSFAQTANLHEWNCFFLVNARLAMIMLREILPDGENPKLENAHKLLRFEPHRRKKRVDH